MESAGGPAMVQVQIAFHRVPLQEDQAVTRFFNG
jgi:hypothetical protein